MIPVHLSPLANHLWQSTLFAAAAMLLTLALSKNRAQTRYRLWLAASLKFAIPFALLVSAGRQFEWRSAPAVAPPLTSAIEQISRPFALPSVDAVATPSVSLALPALLILWLAGFAFVLLRWGSRWRRIQVALRAASPLPIQGPVKVLSSPTLLEPGVFGILRPVLLLPEGIADRLTPAQLQAILAHEFCHVRRRDNLAAALHMVVEAIFWFHPLVWWIGGRMVEERERACDEEVLRLGNQPDVYAESILNVCKFYLESPLACASGVTGSDLKKRVAEIMTKPISHNLTLARKLLLATAGMAAVAGPILTGILHPSQSRAQSQPEALAFEVASVKPGDTNARTLGGGPTVGGGVRFVNVPLKWIIMFAFDMQAFQVSGGPAWIESQRFDIDAKARTEATNDARLPTAEERRQARLRLQALLAERFHLVVRRETKEASVYALVVAKNGLKLKETTLQTGGIRQSDPGELVGISADMEILTSVLARLVGRPVLDKTNLTARYEFTLKFAQERGSSDFVKPGLVPGATVEGASVDSAPSIFTALQEQLGLRLDPQKGPVDAIVIERVEKPSVN